MNFESIKSVVSFFWKFLFGILLCQMAITSIMVLGWMMRVAQRTAFMTWLGRGKLPEEMQKWPNWFRLNRSFVQNWKQGFFGILNIWIFTWPGCLLWAFSWYAGWNNSFHKGYELAWVGPTLGFLGIALFIAAMFYVPIAQARQSVTGEWQRFYNFRTVRKVICRQWFACFCLAGLYALIHLPMMVLKTGPYLLSQTPEVQQISTPAEAKKWLGGFFFVATFIVFPLCLLVRIVGAWIYARGMLLLFKEGRLGPDEIGEREKFAFDQLEWAPKLQPHLMVKTMSTVARTGTGVVIVLVWFLFIAQIYVAQFFLYHPKQGWLNQPSIHLPWCHYIPPELRKGGPLE